MYRRFLEGYKFLLDKLEWVETGLCMVLLAVVVAMYGVEIFTRYFLKYSSPVSAEIPNQMVLALPFSFTGGRMW